jgi:hypothetical protein
LSLFPVADVLGAKLGGGPEDAVVRGEGAFPFPFEPDERGPRARSMLGEGLDAADGRRFGRPAVSDEPTIDWREDVVVVGFFGLMLREEMERREGLVVVGGGGAMLCRRVVDVVEEATEGVIEARLPGGPEML